MLKKLINKIPFLRFWSQSCAKEDRAVCREKGKVYRGPLISYRCALWLGKSGDRDISFEISTGSSPRVSFEIDPSEWSVQFHLSIYFLSWWLTFNGLCPKRFFPKGYEAKEISISYHDGSLWFTLWTPTMSWTRGDWSWSWNWRDILFGRMRYSERDIEERIVDFAMPEGNYKVHMRRFESTWQRKRFPFWPFTRSMFRVKAKPDKPIPVPGKGENSWDCGDDAVHSSTSPSKTFAEAVGSLYASVERPRIKYGSGMKMYVDRKPVY